MTFVRLVVVAMLGVVLAWALQLWYLSDQRRPGAIRRDVQAGEYVTTRQIVPADGVPPLVAGLARVDKRAGDTLAPGELDPIPAGATVTTLLLPPERLLGDRPVVGACVEAWNGAERLTGGARPRIVGMAEPASDGKTLVHLLVSVSGGAAGRVLAAKDVWLSVGSCPPGPRAVHARPGRSVLPIALAFDRSLGDLLTDGVCVDVWGIQGSGKESVRLAPGLEIVRVDPAAADGQRTVYLAGPREGPLPARLGHATGLRLTLVACGQP